MLLHFERCHCARRHVDRMNDHAATVAAGLDATSRVTRCRLDATPPKCFALQIMGAIAPRHDAIEEMLSGLRCCCFNATVSSMTRIAIQRAASCSTSSIGGGARRHFSRSHFCRRLRPSSRRNPPSAPGRPRAAKISSVTAIIDQPIRWPPRPMLRRDRE